MTPTEVYQAGLRLVKKGQFLDAKKKFLEAGRSYPLAYVEVAKLHYKKQIPSDGDYVDNVVNTLQLGIKSKRSSKEFITAIHSLID